MFSKFDDRCAYAVGGVVAGLTLSCLYSYAKKHVTLTKKLNTDSAASFKSAGSYLIDWIVKYRKECRSLPVISTVNHNYLQKALPGVAPKNGEGWAAIFQDLDEGME